GSGAALRSRWCRCCTIRDVPLASGCSGSVSVPAGCRVQLPDEFEAPCRCRYRTRAAAARWHCGGARRADAPLPARAPGSGRRPTAGDGSEPAPGGQCGHHAPGCHEHARGGDALPSPHAALSCGYDRRPGRGVGAGPCATTHERRQLSPHTAGVPGQRGTRLVGMARADSSGRCRSRRRALGYVCGERQSGRPGAADRTVGDTDRGYARRIPHVRLCRCGRARRSGCRGHGARHALRRDRASSSTGGDAAQQPAPAGARGASCTIRGGRRAAGLDIRGWVSAGAGPALQTPCGRPGRSGGFDSHAPSPFRGCALYEGAHPFAVRLYCGGSNSSRLPCVGYRGPARVNGPEHTRSREVFIMSELLTDVRYALRSLRKSPAFAFVTVLTLALGIGANSAIFSVLNGVVLRPLPYGEPDRLVRIASQFPSLDFDRFWLSPPELMELQERNRTLIAVAGYRTGQASVGGDEAPVRVTSAIATHELFDVLDVRPLRGRAFNAEEDAPNTEPVVVLSWELWQRAFAGAEDVFGKRIRVNGNEAVVTGIMPPGFDVADAGVEIWLPAALDRANRQNRASHYLEVIGRI